MANTRDRVPSQTDREINRRIRQETESSIRYYQRHRNQIARRLQELDEEWDIERAVQANAAVVSFAGVVLGTIGKSRWLLLPVLVSGFLFQHATQGWCPPIPLLRRLGYRTAFEIDEARQALTLIRGEYKKVAESDSDVEEVLEAVRT